MPAAVARLFERPLDVNPVELARAAYEAAEEAAIQELVVKARDYHAGESFDVELQAKLAQFVIGGDVSDIKGLNLARKVVNSVLRRLSVQSYDIAGLGEGESEKSAEDQALWASQLWKKNRMDTKQRRVHRNALVDGEAFILVSHDGETGPQFHPHQRYTDPQVDGDGYGCKGHYPNDDISQPMEYASKRWIETYYEVGQKKRRKRMNLYYPDEIQKYFHNGTEWAPWADEDDEAWPISWVEEGTNEPLGIPIIHFINPEERPEASDAFGPQVATDHALVDLLGAAALSAFRIYKVFGFYPTSDGQPLAEDGSNAFKLQPGVIVGTDGKTKQEADFSAIEAGDLTQLQNLINEMFVWAAIVTETPISEFSASGQVAAEGTLKQQEVALLARVEERQDVFGDAWEDVMKMARNLDNYFGKQELDEALEIETTWKDAQTRSEEEIRLSVESKAKTGVPWKQLMQEWGYSADKIEEMEKSDERKASVDAMAMLGQPEQDG